MVDAVVIGAGAAGLSAARQLSHAGREVLVVEARERLGGRVHTVHDAHSPVPIELGAEFVHGEAEETFAIIESARLAVDQLPDGHYWSKDGKLSSIPDFWDRIARLRSGLVRFLARRKADIPVSEYLEKGGLSRDDRMLLQDFVEGYHAAVVDRLSSRWLAGDPDEETGSDNKQFRLAGGNDGLIHWLRGGLDPRCVELRLNTIVTGVEWGRRTVTVRCRNGLGATLGPFRARAAIVTVPIGVLRSGLPRFEPRLEDKERALARLEAGEIFKMVLRFRESFWEEEGFMSDRLTRNGTKDVADLNFLHAHHERVPTWWTARPARAPTITAWAGGPRAKALLREKPAARLDIALDALAGALCVPRTILDDQIESASHHDWSADPFSRGAYTYVGVGGSAAQRDLARPVRGTLFFAGEATDPEQTGTVAGAVASGRRAAKQLLRTM